MHGAGVLDVLPRSDCRRRLLLRAEVCFWMLLKLLQTADCTEVIGVSFILIPSCRSTGNDIHPAHKILYGGFRVLGGLHNREGIVMLMVHTIFPFFLV
jgi:hypothetical protein